MKILYIKIHDYDINSPEKGVRLLSELRSESNVSVDIIRNGQPKKLQYQIRWCNRLAFLNN